MPQLTSRPEDELRAVYSEATSLQAAIDQLLSIELIKEAEHTGIWADETPETIAPDYPSEPEDEWKDVSASAAASASAWRRIHAPTAVKMDIPVELLE